MWGNGCACRKCGVIAMLAESVDECGGMAVLVKSVGECE